jgi:predicted nucleotidyltransferase
MKAKVYIHNERSTSEKGLESRKLVAFFTAIVVLFTTTPSEGTPMVLDQIFGSRLRAKVLGWFFTHTDERFFIRQLESLLAEDPTNLSRELARLETVNILTSETEGRQKYFRVNKKSPFYHEMKGLILKTVGVAGAIQNALRGIKGLKYVFIYGSFAKKQESPESDVDLILVGKADTGKVEEAISTAERLLGRTINLTSYSIAEFHSRLKEKDSFVTTVVKGPKIMLIGAENEIK